MRRRLLICFTVVEHRIVLYTTLQELYRSIPDYALAISCLAVLREIASETGSNPE